MTTLKTASRHLRGRGSAWIATGLLLTCNVFAADHWHHSRIQALYPQANGSFALTFYVDNPACTAPNKYYWVTVGQNGMTTEGAKNIYATAMLAFALDKPVQMNFSDLTTNCFINRLWLAN